MALLSSATLEVSLPEDFAQILSLSPSLRITSEDESLSETMLLASTLIYHHLNVVTVKTRRRPTLNGSLGRRDLSRGTSL